MSCGVLANNRLQLTCESKLQLIRGSVWRRSAGRTAGGQRLSHAAEPRSVGRREMKLPMYVLFWTVLAPVILLTVLSLLIYPVGFAANSIWPDIKPFPVKLVLWSYAALALGVSAISIAWAWRRFRDGLVRTLTAPQ